MARVLRPLRVINRNQGLKLVVKTLIQAIPSVFNVAIVCFIFYFIFGIFFVSIKKGHFHHCFYSHIEMEIAHMIDTKHDCINLGGEWVNRNLNFDDTLHAMQMLFAMSLDDWIVQMFVIVDSRGVNLEPVTDYNRVWIFFFIAFIFLFNFFLLNLFAGVVVSTFNE